ncbi:PQQ-binding-like beta-propeller repeat protein [Occultella aeris]|uniref:PQQ enzyme repeat protein n=1 Tax=Occultella aeris TaxID=2761496 RepID=A0A7M4DK83_9MICO|nr:PQQ-binding-like beta-propeller repeat protein [Occultella aeris]VZO37476.1 PQQ enzyme repeat protein [Occultella aeris]
MGAPGDYDEFTLAAENVPAEADSPVDAGEPGPRLRPSPVTTSSAPAWVAAAVSLIVVGVLTVPPTQPAWGVVAEADLAQAPDEVWSVPMPNLTSWLDTPRVAVFEDRVVVGTWSTVTGYDAADGRAIWSVSEPGMTCAWEFEPLLCRAGRDVDAAILRVDVADGTVSRTPMPGALLVTQTDGDIIALRQDADGQRVVRLQGSDPLAEPRWSTLIGPGLRGEPYAPVLRVVDGEVFVSVFAGFVLDAETGEIRLDRGFVYELPGVIVALESGNSGGRQVVTDGETSVEPVPIAPYGVTMPVDDDPDSDVVFQVRGGTLDALTRTTGEPLWSLPQAYPYPFARLDGRVLVYTDSALFGLVEQTGEQIWTTSASRGRLAWCACVGAGDTVLVGISDADGGTSLAGLDTATGALRWRMPTVGDYPLDVAPTGDHLVLLTNTSLTMWRFESE